ncbi:MAG: PhoH family protein [Burkholderiaceae bacterium]
MPLPPAPTAKASRLDLSATPPVPAAVLALKPSVKANTAAHPAPNTPTEPMARKVLEPAQVVPLPATAGAAKRRAAAKADSTRRVPTAKRRLFVLDTNVLLHDPTSLFRFEEHDVYLPLIVLEELDQHKKGNSEVARNARQTSRALDQLVGAAARMDKGLPLDSSGHAAATGDLFFQSEILEAPDLGLPQGKADNQILEVVQSLRTRLPKREVVLVSKDINMRVKARAVGMPAEDYENDKTLDDGELLYSGALALEPDFWVGAARQVESWQQGMHTYYRVHGAAVNQFLLNQFVYFEQPDEPPLYARVTEVQDKRAVLRTLKDYSHGKHAVWGVCSRNREQNFALNLLMDPDIDFVTLTGTAGTGKTLLALAAGLSQVLDERRYSEIIMTRVTVSVGEDIGFLPGTEEEKMGPWMGALDDNLEFLAKGEGSGAGEWGRAATHELIRYRIKNKSLNFMRGRTFLSKYVIIDEAQNLTPKQMKTLITRAGPGTKLVCLGNLAQIDTPYLTEGSSGLTYVVDRFKGWAHGGHITLARGERSRLADHASDAL